MIPNNIVFRQKSCRVSGMLLKFYECDSSGKLMSFNFKPIPENRRPSSASTLIVHKAQYWEVSALNFLSPTTKMQMKQGLVCILLCK